MKIAIFGGSFDPPHLGHASVVKNALESLDIDKLIIMPTFINPFKPCFFADEKQRFLWAKKVWGDLEKVEISDYELQQKRPVPSIESVLYLKKLYNPSKFYLIIGADHLESLHKWHEFEKLNSLVEFIIAKRDNIAVPKNFKSLNTQINISSSFIRANLSVGDICPQIADEAKRYYANLCERKDTMKERFKAIYKILDEKKAEQIEIFDMRDKEYFVDSVIIATTMGEKHALSLIDELKTALKPLNEEFLNVQSSEEWSVIDLGDILIHLLSEEYRAKYKIEELLSELKKEFINPHSKSK